MQERQGTWKFILILITSSALPAGCGGGGGGSSPPTAAIDTGTNADTGNGAGPTTPTKNSPPQISGAPITSVLQNDAYSFAPAVSDADGDQLTFSVANLPPWASFDSSVGRISGSPGPGDVGIYVNIKISVSDGQSTRSLDPFQIDVVAVAGSTGNVTLSWASPTLNSDGTPLTDLAGFKIYWGNTPDNLTHSVTIDNPGITTYVVENLTPATYYFAASAFNSLGIESKPSNAIKKTVS
jgi:hypothetical protein